MKHAQRLSARSVSKVPAVSRPRTSVVSHAVVADPKMKTAEVDVPITPRPAEPMSYEEVLRRPDSVPAIQLLDAERQAKEAAETEIRTLQAKLAEANGELEIQRADFVRAEAAWRKVNGANLLNKILNKQLKDEIEKAAAARELAAQRYKQQQQATAALREQEKMLLKARKNAELAQQQAKVAKAALAGATSTSEQLRKQAAAHGQRASATEKQNLNLQDALARMQQVESQLRAAVFDAKRLTSLREALGKTKSLNQVLRRQVLSEGARASHTACEAAKYQALARDEERLRQQMAVERRGKEAAQLAFEQATAALELEKQQVAAMIAEAGPTLELIQSEKVARVAAEAAVRGLETKLLEATQRLEHQSKFIADSAEAIKSAAISEEALVKATATIEMLKQQVAAQSQRVNQAKEQAAARSRDLAEAVAKLRETQAAQKLANADFVMATEQSKADREALAVKVSANDSLRKHVATETRRANRAEKHATVLAVELQQTREYGEKVSAELAAINHVEHALTEVSSENDLLKKIVKAEGDRANECEREIVVAHKRITKAEKMMPVLKAEISGLKDTMASLKLQMQRILASKPAMEAEREAKLDAMLESTAAELEKSQIKATSARQEAAQLRESLQETNARVAKLEREMTRDAAAVSPQGVQLVVA